MSNAEGAITRAASQLPQEEGGGDEQRKRGNDSFALSDDEDSHADQIWPTTGPNTPFWRTPPQDIAITDTALTAEILVVVFCDFMELL